MQPREMGRLRNTEYASNFASTSRHLQNGISVQKRPNVSWDSERLGQPSSTRTDENVEEACQVNHEDTSRTINNTDNTLRPSQSIHRRIFTEDFNMRPPAANLCPVHQMVTGNKSDFLPERTETSYLK